MIDTTAMTSACERFQAVAWQWLQSGEMTRTAHMLSPLEELAGFHYGFIYLIEMPGTAIEFPHPVYKIGFSEHPMRRMRELQPQYRVPLKLRACFVGDKDAERFAHRRFTSLRIKNDLGNELFYGHNIIDEYFRSSRERMREQIRTVHICTPGCVQLRARMDLRMLGAWLSR